MYLKNIKQILKSRLNCHKQGDYPNVFIFSTPRSGSTWLQELIWTQPGFKCISEPLNIRVPEIRNILGVDSWLQLYENEEKIRIINYLSAFCNGKYHFRNPNPLKKNSQFLTNRIVFKILNGGEFWINDIAQQCNGKVVYLIRHPIAVSLSRQQLPRLDIFCTESILNHLPAKAKNTAKKIYLNGDFLEKAVLSWCIQNKIALQNLGKNALIITYEQLAVNPNPILYRLSSWLELSHMEKLFSQLSIPSFSSVQSEKETHDLFKKGEEGKKFIEKWRKNLSKERLEGLFSIVNDFDIGIYPEGSLMPDNSYLIH